jgi:hypothetical protein
LKEKSYEQDNRQATEDKKWKETMVAMINPIAPVRILCHPEIRNLVQAVYAPVETKLAIELRDLLSLSS